MLKLLPSFLKFINTVVLIPVMVLCLGYSGGSSAQSELGTIDRVQREHEQLLKQDQLRREDDLRRNQPDVDVFLQEEKGDAGWVGDDESRCFEIAQIQVQGLTLFADEKINEITSEYLNRCLGIQEFNQLIKSISNLYLEKGYVTSRAYIQPQNLKDGVLDVLVVEGRLESIISSEKSLTNRQLRWAFPSPLDQPLNLRDLEQGLENLNRLSQNRSSMELEPAAQPGYTQLQVKNTSGRSVSGGASVNNSGSETTGEVLGSIYASWDNPTVSNDNLYLSFSDSIDAPSGAKSQSYSASYTVPYGYGLFRLSSSYFDYQQQVAGSVVDFTTSGSSASQSLGFDYLTYRGQRDKFTLTSALVRKQSKNYLEDVFLETSSRVLYLAKVGARYTRYIGQAVVRGDINWTRSESWFDATEKIVADENEYQFDTFSIDGSYSVPFALAEQSFSYKTNASLFYTPDKVIASEALSLGGQYTVRGIENLGLVGYSGGYWRNELHHDINLPLLGRLDVFVGLDVGSTDTPEYQEKGREWLAGAVFGAALAHPLYSLNVTYAQSLQSPDYLNAQSQGVYASLQTNF
ncbi:ShlB/FhaC/HecB family hemolysin secretion/activation protein [Gilvimarinus polysaccharolyticus]|uniref:ShlB/FhaC/HecB family hemolysin secretion/activation protein n=1 Tax=Gilvimarinus polysaccharolyticus TaxID=863921 RepID=UPI0006739798|nr:ShlB/FhaC/HecB family hemolysin secretion/activation protein [Gilvimarinus polysaccharolyticus]